MRAPPQPKPTAQPQEARRTGQRVAQRAASATQAAPGIASPRESIADYARSHASGVARSGAVPNRTGLPDTLKNGMEALSGFSLDHVRVHRNSSAPAQLQALAYTKGSDIHLGPGQERHLAHEAWHVVQQARGGVRPTMQGPAGTPINDDAGLEHEADTMGAAALRAGAGARPVQPAAPPLAATAPVVMRRIDPDFDTARGGVGVGLPAITKPEMQTFYDRYIGPDVARYTPLPIEDDLKEAMKNANLRFVLFMLNSQSVDETHDRLNELIAAVNAVATSWEAQQGAAVAAPGEAAWRRERETRQNAVHYVGTTKPMTLRGVNSATEGATLLTNLHNALTGALGGGFALGQVGVRGSAVTGIRSRTLTPFEQGVGAHDTASDASDLDFFFTSPALEAQILATENILPANRRINAGGTMNAQYLHRWLTTAGNGYAHAAALDAALTAFSTAATNLTGRKCDVTFVGGATAAGLAADPTTLIR